MGSNANAFKHILNTFQKYLHLKFSNAKYLHMEKNSNTFKYIFQIVFILQVTEFAAFSFFAKLLSVSRGKLVCNWEKRLRRIHQIRRIHIFFLQ